MSFVIASAPPVPMPVVFEFIYEGQPVENFQVRFTIGTETITRLTNNLGKIGMDVGTGSSDFPSSNPWTDTLIVNCGFSVCNQQYVIDTLDSPYQGKFILAERPATTCPSTDCPDCSCSSSDGGVFCSETELEDKCPAYCDEDTTSYASCKSCCTDVECQDIVCPTNPECPPTDCQDQECPDCPIIVPEGMEGGERLIWLISLVLAVGAGVGGGIYFTRNQTMGKNGGLKTYQGRDGTVKVHHKHPGILGYHDPITSHRVVKERHEKGQLMPHYEKDEEDEWKYVG